MNSTIEIRQGMRKWLVISNGQVVFASWRLCDSQTWAKKHLNYHIPKSY